MEFAKQTQQLSAEIPYFTIPHRTGDPDLRSHTLSSLASGAHYRALSDQSWTKEYGKWMSKAASAVIKTLNPEDMRIPEDQFEGFEYYPQAAYLFDITMATSLAGQETLADGSPAFKNNTRLIRHTFEHAAEHALQMMALTPGYGRDWFNLACEAIDTAILMGQISGDKVDLYQCHIRTARDLIEAVKGTTSDFGLLLTTVRKASELATDGALLRIDHVSSFKKNQRTILTDEEAKLRDAETKSAEIVLLGSATQVAYNSINFIRDSWPRPGFTQDDIAEYVHANISFVNGIIFSEAQALIEPEQSAEKRQQTARFNEVLQQNFLMIRKDLRQFFGLYPREMRAVLFDEKDALERLNARKYRLGDHVGRVSGGKKKLPIASKWAGLFDINSYKGRSRKKRR